MKKDEKMILKKWARSEKKKGQKKNKKWKKNKKIQHCSFFFSNYKIAQHSVLRQTILPNYKPILVTSSGYGHVKV